MSIEDALKCARYQDAVIVTVDSDCIESSKTEYILIATIDKSNGGIIWKNASENYSPRASSSLDVGILRHLRCKKWVIPMLKDEHRNTLYNTAIQNTCKDIVSRIQSKDILLQEDHVIRIVDIGSGTCLLAMMAASHTCGALTQSMSAEKSLSYQIVSVEMASAMARLAKTTVESNSFQDNIIKVVEGHSCDISFPQKFHMCTSELLESGLLGEGILPTMRDAWDRYLYDDALVVPKRARVYAQVFEGKNAVGDYRCPSSIINGIQLGRCSFGSDSGFRGVVVSVHADSMFSSFGCESIITNDSLTEMRALSDPTLAFEFDFSSKFSIPPPEGRTQSKVITAVASGTAHGVLFWWELDLCDSITYSTEVGKCPWQDHWQQCLFVFDLEDKECSRLIEGQNFTLISTHNDSQISFFIDDHSRKNSCKRPRISVELQPVSETLAHDYDKTITSHRFSPERALQLNCQHRMQTIQSAIEEAFNLKGRHASFLDLSDFSLCAIIAAVCVGATKVTSLECSSGGHSSFSALACAENNLPRDGAEFQILCAHPESLSSESIIGGAADIVASEPYYEVLEGWHVQEALNYFFLLKSLKRRGVVQSCAICVPACASIVGCAVELDNSFYDAYSGLTLKNGEPNRICGFDHRDVDRFGNRFYEYDLTFPLWQYKLKKITDTFEIAQLRYEGSNEDMCINRNNCWTSVPFIHAGTCHALVFWVVYKMVAGKDESDNQQNAYSNASSQCAVSTGDRYHRQALRMLIEPITVDKPTMEQKAFYVRFNVETETDDFELQIDCK